jgi:Flp pilus assembly pilin Flp
MLYSHASRLPISAPSSAAPRRGATAMEYLFMISLILVAAIWAIGSLGQAVRSSTQKSATTITNATTGS